MGAVGFGTRRSSDQVLKICESVASMASGLQVLMHCATLQGDIKLPDKCPPSQGLTLFEKRCSKR
eukprot:6196954-Amphidinium_carterae.1